ncbi:HTH domain-containing protein [Culturomica massiliensis]|jgi:DNA-binding IclR family transcriptional regulator|uniref:HTH domain-containing protein n=1 Tax=Culturomica massiliensis TaxID=1841857 RepID=UPI0026659FAB|nr:HTH domain-containing protein [Culturomica massiliensis]
MKIFNILDKMHIFNRLIHHRKTGTPKEFAHRLGISRSTLYDMIDDLRSRGVTIKYSRRLSSFYYDTPVALEVRFTIIHLSDMSTDEIKKYDGGHQIVHSVQFFGRKEFSFAL